MPTPSLVAPFIAQGDVIELYSAAAADGAITQRTGTLYVTKGSAAALTIADPVSGPPSAGGDDGCTLWIVSTTAFAHTVSNAAGSGFNAGGAATDVATFGAAKGNNLCITAYGGKWYVGSQVGITLG
jgi:hypothetical protein